MEARKVRPLKGAVAGASSAVLNKKLEQTTLLLEVIARVNSLMSRGMEFVEFCEEIVSILRNKLKFRFIYIWIRDEKDPNTLKLVTPEQTGGFRTMSVSKGIVGKTVRTERIVCEPDVSRDPDYINVHAETASELCVPLTGNEGAIGAINIESDTYNNFESVLPIVEIIAENLSHSMRLALLYKTEEKFHHLVEYMNEGMWVGDRDERTLYANPALARMMGFKEKELIGKLSYEYFDEKSNLTIAQENEKRKNGIRSHYEATLVARNGERIPVLINGAPFGKGGTMSTLTDLRPLKRTEQKLLETERFLASITQYCPEAIVGLTEDDTVQSWNAAAEQMFGYSAAEILGHGIACIIPEDRIISRESQQILNDAKSKGFIRNFETIRLHKNGKPITVSLTVSALKDSAGGVKRYAVLYRDITAQKKWERELQDRFEKMQDAYKEMGKQRRFLDYLIDMIDMSINAAMPKKQIASFIVNALVMATRVNAATLRLLDAEKQKLILASQNGLGEEWWGKKAITYKGSIAEAAVLRGAPIKLLDILNDSRYTSPALARKNNMRSALVIPLEVKGEILGSLTLYLSQENNLNLLDDEFITVFAKQAAIALKLAR